MGNAGSVHNLHNDYVGSELNLYCTQQFFRRKTDEKRKNHNSIKTDDWSNEKNMANCKVLPSATKNLQLRATSNGAILQAGGSLSFRAKEQPNSELESEMNNIQHMRRCHTLMLDGQNETIPHRTNTQPSVEFRRSQTLFQIDYNRLKTSDGTPKAIQYSPQKGGQNSSAAFTLKRNKYNKKRKAPPAPKKMSLNAENASAAHASLSINPKKSPTLKSRIYVSNGNKAIVTHQQIQLPLKIAPFQRNFKMRTSINTSTPIRQNNPTYANKFWRREKSFDDKLLKQRERGEDNDIDCTIQVQSMYSNHINVKKLDYNFDRNVIDNNNTKKLPTQKDIVRASTHRLKNKCSKNGHNEEKRMRQEEATQFNVEKDLNTKDVPAQPLRNERKSKSQHASRLTQLKRTFYFGMESANNLPNKNCSTGQKLVEGNEDVVGLTHTIEGEKDIIDNGILVNLRPTLPRRQPEIPNFSPIVAWRNLFDEQHCMQLKRLKRIDDSRVIETPICLTTDTKDKYVSESTIWTPQQDLEDDDDDDNKELDAIEVKCKKKLGGEIIDTQTENTTNSLHIFSLSLPRDVHLQCTQQESYLKLCNSWLVPGFSSLQKFENYLGKNIEECSKYNCTPNIATKRNSVQLLNKFTSPFAMVSKTPHYTTCELNKTSPEQNSYKNDNWFLHKTRPNNNTSLVKSSKALDDDIARTSFNTFSLEKLHPKYLNNICGGKHIVYLPEQHSLNDYAKDKNAKQYNTPKTTNTRQRHQEEVVRQSLQDLTPIKNIHQSKMSVNEKSTYRFSFQSTVRILEKRRLAEKLSKDAEIQEAQRVNELEIMKRIEEDFQRKRGPEKANLRNQLRLHLKDNSESSEYRSLPINIIGRDIIGRFQEQIQNISDVNNNVFCRAEPDGAASPTLHVNNSLSKLKCSNSPPICPETSKESHCLKFQKEVRENKPHFQQTKTS